MELKIAVAVDKDGVVFPGHFAHAPVYRIYKYSNGRLELVEERRNPLGDVPDLDHGHHISRLNTDFEGESPEAPPAHGLPKYQWLRSRVLPDVSVVIAGGACQTSYRYFTSEGVKLLFTDPVDVETLEAYVTQNREEFEQALRE